MKLTEKEVRYVAGLANLNLSEDEIAHMVHDLGGILTQMDRLAEIDTTGVEPMAHALELGQRLREDKVTESDRHALYQSVAPAVEGDLYLVPKVIE